MATWTHKGIDIAFNDTLAKFEARIGGKLVRANSIDSLKKQIDKQEQFECFAALRDRRWDDPKGDDYVPCRVVGVTKPRGKYSYRNRPLWVLEGGQEVREVYVDSPENRQALADQRAMQKRHADQDAQQRQEKEDADKRIQRAKFPD